MEGRILYRVCQFRLACQLKPVSNPISMDTSWGTHSSPSLSVDVPLSSCSWAWTMFQHPLADILSFFLPFFFFLVFRATPAAYGGPQARGLIRATATSDQSHVCKLHQSSQQHWILNPLSEARDRTCNLMVPSWIHFHCTTTGASGTHSF